MENRIERIVAACAQRLASEEDVSLYSGNAGTILLLILHSLWTKGTLDDRLEEQVQRLLDMSLAVQSNTLAGGKVGIYWLFSYLAREKGLLDDSLREEICHDLPYLQELSLAELKEGHWDVLHSAMGTAYVSLYNYSPAYQTYFEMFINELNNIAARNGTTGMFPNYDYKDGVFKDTEVNLGLAHGIPSMLKFCIGCYEKNICRQDAYSLGRKIVDFLISHTNADRTHCYFPSVYSVNNAHDLRSRLAWCYGDLGIGIVLYQAGKIFDDQEIVDFALDILKHTTSRKTEAQSMVYDAGFCHGSAGVAHMYNKIWHYTKDPLFKNAADFWIQKTLDFAVHHDGAAGYKAYSPIDRSQESAYNLIEGAAGIGLVLLSYLTGDFSWDYCLMLND